SGSKEWDSVERVLTKLAGFSSANASSSSKANRPPSSIHHQNRCCKMPEREICALALEAAAFGLSAARRTCHTFIASGESTYVSCDSFGDGFTLKIFRLCELSS